MTLRPRAVLVERPTEYDELVARHGTPQAARFFLESRDRSMDDLVEGRARQELAVTQVTGAIPADWRRASVTRSELSRFRFESDDVVIAVGQDGLIANVARHLDGQPVIGINPDPENIAGVLVQHAASQARALLAAAVAPRPPVQERTMVLASTDEGDELHALNEVFVGHPTHQSARYRLDLEADSERQSSSGLLIGSGTGATGWLRSVSHERGDPLPLPAPSDPRLAWFVREAWPSPTTGTDHVHGLLAPNDALRLVVESDRLVCFGDGIESDPLTVDWGQVLTVQRSPRVLNLVAAA